MQVQRVSQEPRGLFLGLGNPIEFQHCWELVIPFSLQCSPFWKESTYNRYLLADPLLCFGSK